ncbi:MAG: methionine gamma-lyase family protein [Oscillospiraceae bacterium]|jgi:cystathionine beta-lyase family protein involved in aluminum resistance|nr:methionine gamma-lyase family protein [Oscillospiraceae bacterium]
MREKDIPGLLQEAQTRCAPVLAALERTEQVCLARVLGAFQAERIGARHFAGTTGYGYGDVGREALERVFARVFGAQDALVRPQIASGTHALAICLYGLLGPGDHLLSGAGKPYDTLRAVIGTKDAGEEGAGSLRALGVAYGEVPLAAHGGVDIPAVLAGMHANTRVVMLQRSRGYAWRCALSIADIQAAAEAIHSAKPDALVMVDNCYGEFVCESEPTMAGADVAVGSLIKNPGGGIAPTGGYIVGREDVVARVARRLTSPGIGREVGSYASGYQAFYQGLFMAPHAVCQALKTAVLAASAFALAGYPVHPAFDAPRGDIIQAIELGSPEKLIAFCRGIQAASPVDSFAVPEPWAMPGYQHEVIMAAGTFVSGASIELSADAPMRPPYIAYLQGGLTFAHGCLGLASALRSLSQA